MILEYVLTLPNILHYLKSHKKLKQEIRNKKGKPNIFNWHLKAKSIQAKEKYSW